jgi:hypothetical protein
MRTLFDDEVRVSYSQIYVVSDALPDMTEAFAGQSNGLCGAGVPGGLFLITGTHTGKVRFTVELHDDEPAAATTDWEEVVEVPYAPTGPDTHLVQWARWDGTARRGAQADHLDRRLLARLCPWPATTADPAAAGRAGAPRAAGTQTQA